MAWSNGRHTTTASPRLARVIACAVVLVFSGCGIPTIRKAEPPPPLPADFDGETSSENSSDLGLAEFYQDPMLLSLFEQALAENRELKIENEEVQVAATEILSRSGTYLPFLTAGPLVGLNRASNRTLEGAALRVDEFAPGRLFSNPHGNYLVGTNLTWQLDIYR
jgi:outer membrane protein TolC